jgi:hypothetical protein
MPGARPSLRGPLEDEDEPSQKRTDQMKEYAPLPRAAATPAPSGVVLKDSFAKEVAEASKQLLDEEAAAAAPTTETVARLAQAPAEAPPEAPPPPVAPKRKSRLPWLLVGLGTAGFAGAIGYMSLLRSTEPQTPLVMAPPPPPPPAKVEPLEKPPEPPPPADPVAVAKPAVPDPAPAPAPAETAKPTEVAPAPAPPPVAEKEPERPKVAMGTLVIEAIPFASLSIDGKLKDAEVVGTKKFVLKPGQYMLKLVHPKRTVTTPVNITANKAVTVPFKAFEQQ